MILEYPDSGARRSGGRLVARWKSYNEILAGGTEMKPSTENQVRGKIHEVKGAIKEQAGRVTNNPDMEDEGTGEKIAGKVQKKIGQVQRVIEKF
jgi:uncharacterized protein YjbJ (UPF0337 family)